MQMSEITNTIAVSSIPLRPNGATTSRVVELSFKTWKRGSDSTREPSPLKKTLNRSPGFAVQRKWKRSHSSVLMESGWSVTEGLGSSVQIAIDRIKTWVQHMIWFLVTTTYHHKPREARLNHLDSVGFRHRTVTSGCTMCHHGSELCQGRYRCLWWRWKSLFVVPLRLCIFRTDIIVY